MPRTTVDIDAPVLRELKRRQKRERKSLGRLVSDLLARALNEETPPAAREFKWIARPLGAKIDLEDKEALWDALDADEWPHRKP